MSIKKLKSLIKESESLRGSNWMSQLGKSKAKAKALDHAKHGEPRGRTRLLSKAESREKTKNWPKSKGPMSHAEKMQMLGE